MKRRKCPICKNYLKEIIYGIPMKNMDLDKYILGGCVLLGTSPKYFCPKCEKYFDKKIKPMVSEEK